MNHTAHRIVVRLDSLKPIDKTCTALAARIDTDRLEIFTWDTLMPGLKQTINLDLISGFIMYGIFDHCGLFSGYLNTFSDVDPGAQKEYGVLIAIGTNEGLVTVLRHEARY